MKDKDLKELLEGKEVIVAESFGEAVLEMARNYYEMKVSEGGSPSSCMSEVMAEVTTVLQKLLAIAFVDLGPAQDSLESIYEKLKDTKVFELDSEVKGLDRTEAAEKAKAVLDPLGESFANFCVRFMKKMPKGCSLEYNTRLASHLKDLHEEKIKEKVESGEAKPPGATLH